MPSLKNAAPLFLKIFLIHYLTASFSCVPYILWRKHFPNGSCTLLICTFSSVGGMVASWFVRSTQDREVRVRYLAADIALCSWANH